MEASVIRRLFILLSSVSFALIGKSAFAYQRSPVVITGEPVAPPILDQEGNGFCVTSQKANYGKFNFSKDGTGTYVFDAGSIFGNEEYITTPSLQPIFGRTAAYRYNTGRVSQGLDFPKYVNFFMDKKYFPGGDFPNTGVFDTILTGKMNLFFDLSQALNGNDPNGDFTSGNSVLLCPNPKGCPFPTLSPTRNFNPADDGDVAKNQYADPYLKQAFPEVTGIDLSRNFAMRFRGFLNIKKEMLNVPIYFGIYADDGAALIISDKGREHVVISVTSNRCESCTVGEPCQSVTPPTPSSSGGNPLVCGTDPTLNKAFCEFCNKAKTGQRWRVTNSVTFLKEGMYPIEILYVGFGGNNALEVATRMGDPPVPPGFQLQTYQNWGYPSDGVTDPTQTYPLYQMIYPGSTSLKDQGFTLLDPKWIFQSTTGRDIGCNSGQCTRFPVNPEFTVGCKKEEFCNEAGICEPCGEKNHCGRGCTPCSGSTPECDIVGAEFQCVACRRNSDCRVGQTCDLKDHQCHCTEDSQCAKGQTCQGTVCKTCSEDKSCAGNSCSCCRSGMKCAVTDRADAPSCVECTSILDCDASKNETCDMVNHRCVSVVPRNNANTKCGANGDPCPTDHPFCVDGRVCVECRSDMDCGETQYCLSGECSPCTSERRCGATCRGCTPDKPFCDGRRGPQVASCVGCFKDEHCGQGGRCNLTTGTCDNTCTINCPTGTLCDGNRCIQCRSNAHCGCSQYCDTATGQCEGRPGVGSSNGGGSSGGGGGAACQSSEDCQGDECCSPANQCDLGHCKTTVTAQGGALCCNMNPQRGSSNVSILPERTASLLWVWVLLGSMLLVAGTSVFRKGSSS